MIAAQLSDFKSNQIGQAGETCWFKLLVRGAREWINPQGLFDLGNQCGFIRKLAGFEFGVKQRAAHR